MKSFLVTNLFLSLATVAVANYGVNMAMGTSVTTFKLGYSTNTTIKKEISYTSISKIKNLKNSKLEITKESVKNKKILPIKRVLSKSDKAIKKVQLNPAKMILPKSRTKINKVSVLNTGVDLELSYQEIKEQGEYSIKKLQKVSWNRYELNLNDYSNLDKSNIAAVKQEEKKRISNLAAYSPVNSEKSEKELPKITSKEESNNNTSSDELVFFDYNESQGKPNESLFKSNQKEVNQEEVKKKAELAQKTNTVKFKAHTSKTISPKLDFNNIGKLIKKNGAKLSMNNLKTLRNDKVKTAMSATKKESTNETIAALFKKTNEYACLDEKKIGKKITHKSKYNVGLNSIQNNNKEFKKIYNFDIRFQDDVDDIAQDYGEGNISLEYDLTTQMNIRRGVIYTKSHYPTAVDLVFEPGVMNATIPVLHMDTFNSLVDGYRAQGGHILVELDDTTEDVELDVDTKYEGKLFLNSALKIVNRNDSEYNYIMFIGVSAGNSIIHFKKSNNKITNKIIHITNNEIYYEPNFYAEIKVDRFNLYEENLLSKCKSILDVDEEKIKPWSFEGNSTKTSLNNHEIGQMLYPLGTRKYYELKHLNESIFIGRWSSESLIIPSEDYINHVMSYFEMGNSDSQCVIQLNIDKKAKNIYYNGISSEGPMPIQMNILDSDGQFYSDFSEKSERVFLLGEQQGIINIKLEYIDGTTQYLQSYCSEATYLIEQL
jgi:hypothetical protein